MDGFTGADGGGADGLGSLGCVEEAREHVDAVVLDLGGLGILVLIDVVLAEGFGEQAVGVVIHPCGDEGGEVERGVAIEVELVLDDAVGDGGGHALFGEDKFGDGLGCIA